MQQLKGGPPGCMRAAGPGKLKPGVLKRITYTQRPAVTSSSGSAVRHLALLYRLGVRAVALRFLVARKKVSFLSIGRSCFLLVPSFLVESTRITDIH